MSTVGGFNVHHRQMMLDYVDTDMGRVQRGRVTPACRSVLRRWPADRFGGRTDVAFTVEACTGWRFVVEELERGGIAASLAKPPDTAAARGRKRRATSDAADAALLRELLAGGGYRSRGSRRSRSGRCARFLSCTRNCGMSTPPGCSASTRSCFARACRSWAPGASPRRRGTGFGP